MKNLITKINNKNNSIKEKMNKLFEIFINSKELYKMLILNKFVYFTKFIKIMLQRKTGISWNSVLDGLFIGTLFLITFKFIFRIFFAANPYWLINLFIYLTGILLQIKNPQILIFIREQYVKILKTLLGYNFWYVPEIDNWMWKNETELGYEHDAGDPKLGQIKETNNINKFFQHFVFFFIGIRIIILNNPIKFLFLNFIITFWLIINQFLITSSIASILLLISKLTLYLSDINNSNLMFSLNKIEKIDLHKNKIKLNIHNIKTITFWIIRTFTNRNAFIKTFINKKNNLNRFIFRNNFWISDIDACNIYEFYFYMKYNQININKFIFCHEIYYNYRNAKLNDENKLYIANSDYHIIKIKNNNIFNTHIYIIIFFCFFILILIAFVPSKGQQIEKSVSSLKYKFYKVSEQKTNKIKQKAINKNEELEKKSDFFQPTSKNIIPPLIFDPKKYVSQKALSHPQQIGVDNDTKHIIIANSSTKRIPDAPGLAKLSSIHGNDNLHGYCQVGITISLENQKYEEISNYLSEAEEKGNLQRHFLDLDFEIIPIYPKFFFDKQLVNSALFNFYDNIFVSSNLVLPDSYLSSFAVFSQANDKQIYRSIESKYKYHEAFLTHYARFHLDERQKYLHVEELKKLQNIKRELDFFLQLRKKNPLIKIQYEGHPVIESRLCESERISVNLEKQPETIVFLEKISPEIYNPYNLSSDKLVERHITNSTHLKSLNKKDSLDDLD